VSGAVNVVRRFSRSKQSAEEHTRRRALALHAYFQLGVLHYVLSDNSRVPEAVGQFITKDPHVEAVGDALFSGTSVQIFRFVDEQRR
jgi:hypothetical protein